MKKSKKLDRQNLKSINGGIGNCNDSCPAGPYGPGELRSCADFYNLSPCCQGRVIVSYECFGPY